MDILTPISGGPAKMKEESRQSLNFNSPPHTAFGGIKRLSSAAFAEVTSSSKRKRTSSRSPALGSPAMLKAQQKFFNLKRNPKANSLWQQKLSSGGKKITNNNKMIVFDAVTKRKRYVIDFDEGPQYFYRIMTHYAPDLNFTPDDVKHKELQQNLFTFVMQNVSYTKVFLVFFPLLFL